MLFQLIDVPHCMLGNFSDKHIPAYVMLSVAVFRLGCTDLVSMALGAKLNVAYCDILMPRQLLAAMRHITGHVFFPAGQRAGGRCVDCKICGVM